MPKQRGLYDHTIWIVLKEKETNKDNYYKNKSYGKKIIRSTHGKTNTWQTTIGSRNQVLKKDFEQTDRGVA
ncbi:hypothetical protein MTR_3g088620 [Medicago truncatula]|uniref:Uncharacterized protein n=1 Tax=Medicago truncatula TaxID=3880 RepID=G7J508_MEDTR|nr:hypothetical protein MTR_3g088620 [Medicago truncatula]